MPKARNERAWFRAGAKAAWHAVDRRNDVLLVGRCGYAREWARSQQLRSVEPPDGACSRCLERLAR